MGSGKSSLFNAILGELRLSSDQRKYQHKVDEGLQKLKFAYNNEHEDGAAVEMEDIFININGSVAFF